MDKDAKWYQWNFKFKWDIDAKPNWYNDLIVAHQICLPFIRKNEERFKYWHFHRRAPENRDQSGHLFQLFFYTDKDISKSKIDENQIIRLLETEIFPDIIPANETSIIPKDWPEEIKKNWPYYIMGISKMWLYIIDDLFKKEETKGKNLEAIYVEIQKKINNLWKVHGGDCFIHQLNAIFEYQPTLTRITYTDIAFYSFGPIPQYMISDFKKNL